jgi:hypothetical protein
MDVQERPHMGLTYISHTTVVTILSSLYFLKHQTAKSPTLSNRALLNRSLAMSYSHMGTPTLPSALTRFTSEFGMGSGGAMSLLSLDKKGTILKAVH